MSDLESLQTRTSPASFRHTTAYSTLTQRLLNKSSAAIMGEAQRKSGSTCDSLKLSASETRMGLRQHKLKAAPRLVEQAQSKPRAEVSVRLSVIRKRYTATM